MFPCVPAREACRVLPSLPRVGRYRVWRVVRQFRGPRRWPWVIKRSSARRTGPATPSRTSSRRGRCRPSCSRCRTPVKSARSSSSRASRTTKVSTLIILLEPRAALRPVQMPAAQPDDGTVVRSCLQALELACIARIVVLCDATGTRASSQHVRFQKRQCVRLI